jgi:RHH-type proline utilization regulon transcriptional repressor/proline dehydrogenase/delta 1-pyrroline-5-carboxylate dehydrogenase
VIETPRGKLEWALTTLEEGESWLVAPELIEGSADADAARPGACGGPASASGCGRARTHLEEFFGPMLGIMHASSLSEAVELQNAVAYGLTAGLYTQDPADLELWLDQVEAGNLYVNRGITGRSCSASRSAAGSAPRSAPAQRRPELPDRTRLVAARRGAPSSTLHLRGLDARITTLIESAQPSLDYEAFEWLRRGALSDAVAWDRSSAASRTCRGSAWSGTSSGIGPSRWRCARRRMPRGRPCCASWSRAFARVAR